ncbi:MAG: flagellar motor switch protein FliN [Candidatus Marinimicrobia bacterium]|nr:flagellar motor switch protein FliN [Candidatus Neomarinimicrobiota bacterium]MCF7880511.1 flagellar motor switch protein FliN [Candidatus Neomarinimicrobiota bacterium]
MADDQFTGLREFEEKIIDITSDNLEIITGQQFTVEIEHVEEYTPEIIQLLTSSEVRTTVVFENEEYDPWQIFLPGDLGAFLASTMIGEDPSLEFDPENQTEPLQELMAQIMSPYLSELSSIAGEQVDASEITITQSTEQPDLSEESAIFSYQVSVAPDHKFSFYKVVPKTLTSLIDAGDEEPDAETPAQDETEAGEQQVEMDETQFQQFRNKGTNGKGANLDMLMDLQMPITIELGRTKLTIKNILQLGQGSIIELDKLSGDPVDVYINDRKFAEGEVVVVDENFGVRITEIVSPAEKIKSLQ